MNVSEAAREMASSPQPSPPKEERENPSGWFVDPMSVKKTSRLSTNPLSEEDCGRFSLSPSEVERTRVSGFSLLLASGVQRTKIRFGEFTP